MENTANGSGTIAQFFGVPNSEKMDTIVEDKFLRKAIVDASIKMENMVLNKQITLERRIVSKTEWGLEIWIEMRRPKEDKPIIFTYSYRINRVTFKTWLDNHAYLMEGPAMAFVSRGLDIVIPGPGTEKYYKTVATVVVKYMDDDTTVDHMVNLVNETLVVVAHREVVNNHDWGVKCIVP